MRIAGWQRVGIVCSVLWIFGAGIYQHVRDFESAKSQAFEYGQGCYDILTPDQYDTSPPPTAQDFLRCDYAQIKWQKMLMQGDTTNMALLAFLPIPFGWLLIYLVLFTCRFVVVPTYRWVKRGLPEKS